MTDMRATERLLEVIEEEARVLAELSVPGSPAADAANARASRNTAAWNLGQAIGELRRRGDTLVRRDDLRRVLEQFDPYDCPISNRTMDEARSDPTITDAVDRLAHSRDRLEIALGGKLR